MLSLFYKISETKIPNGTFVTIFKPEKENQTISIKGKLGQYKSIWECHVYLNNTGSLSLNWNPSIGGEEDSSLKINRDLVSPGSIACPKGARAGDKEGNQYLRGNYKYTKQLGRIWTENYINETEFLAFKKENKRFLYNKETRKIEDLVVTIVRTKDSKKTIIDKLAIFVTACSYKGAGNLRNKTKREMLTEEKDDKETNKIYMGHLISLVPFKNPEPLDPKEKDTIKVSDIGNEESELNELKKQERNLTEKEEKNLNKQIKNITSGVTQGYSMNLESKGIGYQAQVKERIEALTEGPYIDNKKKVRNINETEWNVVGQLESNMVREKCKWNFGTAPKSSEENELDNSQEEGEKKGNLFTSGYKRESLRKGIELKKDLILNIGTSHDILFPLNEHEIDVGIGQSPNNFVTLSIFGTSRAIMSQVAANIYLSKKPEPYKGKGIRYDNEKFFPKEKTKKN
jgi:ribosomal protein L6P/L9E